MTRHSIICECYTIVSVSIALLQSLSGTNITEVVNIADVAGSLIVENKCRAVATNCEVKL
ncbi:MAG TPA: hypothetical protein VEH06_03410 [Candidatus Bathyarchaeia archaeon]|nr:hypothetical protein [Candidatus Bathyarchaeia archaeon]